MGGERLGRLMEHHKWHQVSSFPRLLRGLCKPGGMDPRHAWCRQSCWGALCKVGGGGGGGAGGREVKDFAGSFARQKVLFRERVPRIRARLHEENGFQQIPINMFKGSASSFHLRSQQEAQKRIRRRGSPHKHNCCGPWCGNFLFRLHYCHYDDWTCYQQLGGLGYLVTQV